jgi:hypothetical protein
MAAPKKFTLEHACDKSDITPMAAKIGLFNARTYHLDGSDRLPGTLLFRGFAGALDKASGKYRGLLRFEAAQAGDEFEAFDFHELTAGGGE